MTLFTRFKKQPWSLTKETRKHIRQNNNGTEHIKGHPVLYFRKVPKIIRRLGGRLSTVLKCIVKHMLKDINSHCTIMVTLFNLHQFVNKIQVTRTLAWSLSLRFSHVVSVSNILYLL